MNNIDNINVQVNTIQLPQHNCYDDTRADLVTVSVVMPEQYLGDNSITSIKEAILAIRIKVMNDISSPMQYSAYDCTGRWSNSVNLKQKFFSHGAIHYVYMVNWSCDV